MAVAFLIPELENVLQQGSGERRAEALSGITDLFLQSSQRYNDDHIRLFDDIFVRLIAEIETKARQELSQKLAPIANSPSEVIRRLAKDDDILVAGPVLEHSPRLALADLVDVASSKGAEHLYAICGRSTLEAQVSDIVVRRGDPSVKRRLAGNRGAQISESAFAALLRSSEHDNSLAEIVGLREDIPDHMFRELIARATEVVQRRLLSRARPETQAEIRRVLASVSDVVRSEKPERDFAAARQKIEAMATAQELDESKLAEIARSRCYEDTVVALSRLCSVPIDVVDRLLGGDRPDPILILCKAAGYSWPTARDLILSRTGIVRKAAISVDSASQNFDKLSTATAKRVVRFWQMAPVSLRATA